MDQRDLLGPTSSCLVKGPLSDVPVPAPGASANANASDGPQKASTPSKKSSPNERWRREISRQLAGGCARASKCQRQGCVASEPEVPHAPCRCCDRPTMQSSSKIRQMTAFEIAWYCIRARFGAPHRAPCLVSQPRVEWPEWVDPSIAPPPVNRKGSLARPLGPGWGSVQAAARSTVSSREDENLLCVFPERDRSEGPPRRRIGLEDKGSPDWPNEAGRNMLVWIYEARRDRTEQA